MTRDKGRTTGRLAKARSVGLPARPFLFTLDQVADLLSVTEDDLIKNYIYFFGRSEYRHRAGDDYLRAVNIAPADRPASWRISEENLLNWLRDKGIMVYH